MYLKLLENQYSSEKIKSIKEIIFDYDNFIIDQWGVMHDGIFGMIMLLILLIFSIVIIKICL